MLKEIARKEEKKGIHIIKIIKNRMHTLTLRLKQSFSIVQKALTAAIQI